MILSKEFPLMKLLLIAPEGLEVQGFKGSKHVHHLNLAVVAALATHYFKEIKIVEDEVEMVWDEILTDFMAGALKPVYRSDQLIDLRDLPMPRKDLFRNHLKGTLSDVIQSGRGCPLGCEFCTVTQMYGKKFRTRPVEHVVEEIKRFKSKRLFFVDDNIFLSRSYAYELFEALVPLKIKWGSQGSMELICRDEDLLELAARSGCVSLFVGIETTDQETLNGLINSSTRSGITRKTSARFIGRASAW